MRTITIAICEDHPASIRYIRESIQDGLTRDGINPVISSYSSSETLLRLIQEGNSFEMYFLDIDMPKVSGLDLAAQIRRQDTHAAILFVSAREEYVFEAIRQQPFRFVRKEHFRADLEEALQAYLKASDTPRERKDLVLSTATQMKRFYLDEIWYMQAQDNYLLIVTAKGKTLVRHTMSDMESRLAKEPFLRIHKSYLVNFSYIHVLHPKEVILENGMVLPVGRSRYPAVQKLFLEYMQRC